MMMFTTAGCTGELRKMISALVFSRLYGLFVCGTSTRRLRIDGSASITLGFSSCFSEGSELVELVIGQVGEIDPRRFGNANLPLEVVSINCGSQGL